MPGAGRLPDAGRALGIAAPAARSRSSATATTWRPRSRRRSRCWAAPSRWRRRAASSCRRACATRRSRWRASAAASTRDQRSDRRRRAVPTRSTPTCGRRWARKARRRQRRAIFQPYQVNAALMARRARASALHALPARAPRRRSHRRGDRLARRRSSSISPRTACIRRRPCSRCSRVTVGRRRSADAAASAVAVVATAPR